MSTLIFKKIQTKYTKDFSPVFDRENHGFNRQEGGCFRLIRVFLSAAYYVVSSVRSIISDLFTNLLYQTDRISHIIYPDQTDSFFFFHLFQIRLWEDYGGESHLDGFSHTLRCLRNASHFS